MNEVKWAIITGADGGISRSERNHGVPEYRCMASECHSGKQGGGACAYCAAGTDIS